jgi:hypothetical protein
VPERYVEVPERYVDVPERYVDVPERYVDVMDVALRRRTKVVFGLFPAAITAAAVYIAPVPAAGAGALTASSVIRSAASAIARQPSAHVVFIAHSGARTERIVADVGRDRGTETAVEGSAVLAVRLSPTHAYVSGNSSGLTELFGMSATDAAKVGKDWESWKSGTSQYANLKTDVTMSSVGALLPKARRTSLATVVVAGATSYVLKWTIAATSSIPQVENSLTVSGAATDLPVKEVALVSTGSRATTTLSGWGEHITIVVPPGDTTITSGKVAG